MVERIGMLVATAFALGYLGWIIFVVGVVVR